MVFTGFGVFYYVEPVFFSILYTVQTSQEDRYVYFRENPKPNKVNLILNNIPIF